MILSDFTLRWLDERKTYAYAYDFQAATHNFTKITKIAKINKFLQNQQKSTKYMRIPQNPLSTGKRPKIY